MNNIGEYKNGNYFVRIYEDGTKIRWNDEDHFDAEFPESIDVKAIDKCSGPNGNLCKQCHEQSTPNGVLGDLNNPILETLHPYTELAIGGGNPLEHPDLPEFLQRMKARNVICNLTVNLEHFLTNRDMLMQWSDRQLIHGVGISVGRCVSKYEAELISSFPNSVVHVIAGIVTNDVLQTLADHDIKLLILGYKKVGRGIAYYEARSRRIDYLIKMLSDGLSYWKDRFKLISFDNLGVQQLDVRTLVTEEEWNEYYMGEDGQFTMYMDLCENKYAVASTMERHAVPDDVQNIDELFAKVKKEAGEKHGSS